MSDHEEISLADEFVAFRVQTLGEVAPPGPAAVRNTVRRRRRIAGTSAAVLALVLVAGPAVTYAALNRSPGPPPSPSDSVGPTAPPSPSTSPSPSASPSPSTTPTAPDGRISRAELLDARLDLPPWQPGAPVTCSTDGVRLADPPVTETRPVLMQLAYGDADGDGAQESIAILGCRPGQVYLQQVTVFDRDEAGAIVTLAQVTRTGHGFDWITGVKAGSPGSVQVQVGDIQPCCLTPRHWAQRQWRTYGWDGERFRQTDGPTAFGPHPKSTDLQVQVTDLVFGTPDGHGRRHGTMTVTVTNAGPKDVALLGIDYSGEALMNPDDATSSACNALDVAFHSNTCLVEGLKVGEHRTYTLGFWVVGAPSGEDIVSVANYDSSYLEWPDRDPRNNQAKVQVRYQG